MIYGIALIELPAGSRPARPQQKAIRIHESCAVLRDTDCSASGSEIDVDLPHIVGGAVAQMDRAAVS
jgi:hypothetical protein